MSRQVNRVRQVLQQWNTEQKSRVRLTAATPDQLGVAKQSDTWEFNLSGQTVERVIIYLRQAGCVFALNTGGGCTMCAHSLIGTTLGGPGFTPAHFIEQFVTEYAKYQADCYPVLCLYNEGNMLNPHELPLEAQRPIFNLIRETGAVKRLIIESRSEYITARNIEFALEHLGQVELEVGIGLESVNDFVRNDLMLKLMTLRSFEAAVAVLKRYGVRSLAYVVLKPPFLNETQALADAVATARYAFGQGCSAVSLEPIGVEPYTLMDSLYQANLFKPAWLWSVLETTRQLVGVGELRIGGYQFAPIPETLPANCPACNAEVVAAIRQWNRTYDPAALTVSCPANCKADWQNELAGLPVKIDEAALEKQVWTAYESCRRPEVKIPDIWLNKYRPIDRAQVA